MLKSAYWVLKKINGEGKAHPFGGGVIHLRCAAVYIFKGRNAALQMARAPSRCAVRIFELE